MPVFRVNIKLSLALINLAKKMYGGSRSISPPILTSEVDGSVLYLYYNTDGGTMLEAGRSWVRFPTRPLDFSIDLILLAALWSWG
jgi:hypothetical protein